MSTATAQVVNTNSLGRSSYGGQASSGVPVVLNLGAQATQSAPVALTLGSSYGGRRRKRTGERSASRSSASLILQSLKSNGYISGGSSSESGHSSGEGTGSKKVYALLVRKSNGQSNGVGYGTSFRGGQAVRYGSPRNSWK